MKDTFVKECCYRLKQRVIAFAWMWSVKKTLLSPKKEKTEIEQSENTAFSNNSKDWGQKINGWSKM